MTIVYDILTYVKSISEHKRHAATLSITIWQSYCW